VIPTITVIKRDGKRQRYNRFNIYTSIYRAAYSWPQKEEIIDRITDRVESSILDLGKKEVTTEEIAEIVLRRLRFCNLNTFLRYLTYTKRPKTEQEFQRYLRKYQPFKKKPVQNSKYESGL
jgi:transcriptional repressor NrdR